MLREVNVIYLCFGAIVYQNPNKTQESYIEIIVINFYVLPLKRWQVLLGNQSTVKYMFSNARNWMLNIGKQKMECAVLLRLCSIITSKINVSTILWYRYIA